MNMMMNDTPPLAIAMRMIADMIDCDDPAIDLDALAPIIDAIANDDTPAPARALRAFIDELMNI